MQEKKENTLIEVLDDEVVETDKTPETILEDVTVTPAADAKNEPYIITEDQPEEAAEAAETEAAPEENEKEKKKAAKAAKAEAAKQKKAEKKAAKKKARTKQQIRLAVFGALACFFIVIGIISSISFVWNGAVDLIENKALKEEIGYAVFPLVIVDAPEFDSAETLDSSVVVSTSIWRLILDADLERYEKDDVGGITVPDVDIEYYARQMYGDAATILHQTISDSLVMMNYASENKNYLIESSPIMLPYSPRVDKVQQSGDVYTATVSYLLPDVSWSFETYRNEIVEKEMEFTLQKTENGWRILSSKLLGVVNEEPSKAEPPEGSELPELSVEESEEESVEESSEESTEDEESEKEDKESEDDESSKDK